MLQSLMILFDCLSVYSAVKKKKLHVRGKDGQFPKASQNEAKIIIIKCEGNTFCIL